MFGIGIGEILLILFVAFLINPRELPVLIKKVSNFISYTRSIKEYFLQIQDDVEDVLKEGKIDPEIFGEDLTAELVKKKAKRNVKENKNKGLN